MKEELNEPQAQHGFAPKEKEDELEAKDKRVSLDEYLEMIADGERRLEYHNGQVIDIQSATRAHGRICTNLTSLIDAYLLEKDCDVYAGDRELWVEKCKKMFYPDLVVVCGGEKVKQMSKNVEATINPSVVIEVLSDSTEMFDLTTKLKCYKTMKSLKQIIFVAQTDKYIRVLERDDEKDRLWHDMEYFEDDENIPIGDCNISLKDIYRRVEFNNQPERATEV